MVTTKQVLECLGFIIAVVAVLMVMVVIVLELKPWRQTNIYYGPLEVKHGGK